MKRRRFFQAMAAAPAVPALLGQQPAGPPPGMPGMPGGAASAPLPKLDTSSPDEAASGVLKFFSTDQLSALRKLSETLMPPLGSAPGALEAGTPEFLDFYIGESPKDRQAMYKTGLDTLNKQAKAKFGKLYGDLDTAQAGQLLEPLKKPWAYDPPTDPQERFLKQAKADIRQVTMNSKQYSAAASSGGNRRFGGAGLYWLPLD